MFYPHTIAELRTAIEERFPGTKSACMDKLPERRLAPPSYLLWMCDEVSKMKTDTVDDAVKAARWMGWVFTHVELYGIWGNNKTRDLVRVDRKNGHDKPH